jgi:hypothetical protein
MDLIDLFWFCLIVLIVSRIANFFLEGLEIAQMENHIKKLKHLNDIIHQVKIEEHNDMQYWFDKDDDEFLGQGRTTEEVISVLQSRFPKHVFLLGELGGIGEKTDWTIMNGDQLREKLARELRQG